MLSSSWFKFILISTVSLMTTVGCWSPDRDSSNSGEHANFYATGGKFVGPAEPIDSTSKKTIETMFGPNSEDSLKLWDMNFLSKFTFEVCLTEKGSEKSIYRKTFKIVDESNKHIAVAKTLKNGCLRWSEPIFYNFLAPSKYLKMLRKIVGGGVYSGEDSFHIIINPWEAQRDGVVSAFIPKFEGDKLKGSDYEIIEDPEIIKAALAGKYDLKELDGQLFLEGFSYSLDKIEGSKISSEFYLSIDGGTVIAKVRDANGKYRNIEMRSGAYKVSTKIMQGSVTTNNKLLPLSLYHPNFSGQEGGVKKSITAVKPIFYLNNSTPNTQFPFHNYSDDKYLKGSIPLAIENWKRQKQVRILLELEGYRFPFKDFLKPLKAVYRGGKFEKGSAKLMQTKEHSLFKKSGLFSKGETEFDKLMDPVANLANPDNLPIFNEYTIGAISLNFLSQANGESISNRGIKYLGKVCLTQRHGEVRPQGQKFMIRIFSETKNADINFNSRQRSKNIDSSKPYKTEVARFSTEDGGCLSWVDEIWFKHYKQETYFIYRAEIQEVGSDQVLEVKYAINPWDEGWTFGRDLRDTDAPFLKEIRDQKKVASRIFLPRFSYETLRFKYDIDKYLNLNVKKQVLFDFTANTLRYNSNKSGRFGVYHQRDGVYLLKTAMEKNYLDPSSSGIWVRSTPDNCDPAMADCHASTKFLTCPDGKNTCHQQEKRNYLEGPIKDPNRPRVAMKRHLSVVSRLVRVIGGRIITPVEFEVKDLRVMRLRSNLFVQMDPVDEWMLWAAKLYDELYVKVYRSRFGDGIIGPQFQAERKRNIQKIIKRMKKDPRAIHNSNFVYNTLKARDDRVIKNAINEDGEQQLETVTHKDGKTYEVCHSPQNVPVTWDDMFDFFGMDNSILKSRTGVSDLGKFHRKNYDNSYIYEKREKDEFTVGDSEGEKCLYVYNVIRNLLENDHSKMPLNPIDYVSLTNFIDEDSGLEQTTFFGPMTYLENGNSSNMRPTKNISEFVCPSGDCDEVKNQYQLARDLEVATAEYLLNPKNEKEYLEPYFKELNANGGHGSDSGPRPFDIDGLDESVKYKLSDEFLEKSGKKINSYEISRFFGSLKYANNLLIHRYQEPDTKNEYAEGDLETEMHRLKDLDRKENEVRSKLFYYLNNFNLDFVSLGNERVKFYDSSAKLASGANCNKLSQVPFKVIADESSCYQETEMYTNEDATTSFKFDRKTIKSVRNMIQTLKITPELAGKICYHQLNRFDLVKFNVSDLNYMKRIRTTGDLRTALHNQTKTLKERTANNYFDKTPPEQLRFYTECVSELVDQVNIDPIKKFDIINGSILDIERKVRVKRTGRYAFKGGKALNVNVGNQVTLNHNSSYSFSESRGFGMKDIKNILFGWFPKFKSGLARWAESVFDTGSGMIVGDQKWTESDTNSKAEGTSISEGTFLVMQNATLDVELEDYYQCVSITFSETFLNRIGIKGESYKEAGKVEPLIKTLAEVNGVEGSEAELMMKKNVKKFKSAVTRGLLICDDSEWNLNKSNYRTLPIRENFYYFTQHFTEGDMLDAGDLANHPWLKAIRGKTDMWRFLSKIRNQDMSLRGKEKTVPYAKYLEQMGIDRKYLRSKGKKLGFRTQRGDLNMGDEWPIYQLIKAYHGTVPTFPGVYSSLHSPCNYVLDFPWGDQAKDSFNPEETAMFDNYENRAKNKIKESIQKFHDDSFNTDDKSVQASIEDGVYKTDADYEANVQNIKSKYPDTAAKFPEVFKNSKEDFIFPYEKANGSGSLKYQNMIILTNEGDQDLDKPSKERIKACLGYTY